MEFEGFLRALAQAAAAQAKPELGGLDAATELSLAYAAHGSKAFDAPAFVIDRRAVRASHLLVRALAADDVETLRAITGRLRVDRRRPKCVPVKTKRGTVRGYQNASRHDGMLGDPTAWCMLRDDAAGLETLRALFGGLYEPRHAIEYCVLNSRVEILKLVGDEPRSPLDPRPMSKTKRWARCVSLHLAAADDPVALLDALLDAGHATPVTLDSNLMTVAAARDRGDLFRRMRTHPMLRMGRGDVSKSELVTCVRFGAMAAFRELWDGYGYRAVVGDSARAELVRCATDGRRPDFVVLIGGETETETERASGESGSGSGSGSGRGATDAFRNDASDRVARRVMDDVLRCRQENAAGWHRLCTAWGAVVSVEGERVGSTVRGIADALVDRMRRDGDENSDWSTFFWLLRHLGYAKSDLPAWVFEGRNRCFRGLASLCAAFGLGADDFEARGGLPVAAFDGRSVRVGDVALFAGYHACSDKLFEAFERHRFEMAGSERDASVARMRMRCGYGAVKK